MNRVQRWRPAMLTAMATILLMAGLGWLTAAQRADGNKPQEAAAVTASPQIVSVTEARLVDYLSDIPLQLRLSRAAWNGDGLTIDMKVASTIARPDAIYHDIYELLQHSFTRTDNVNRLLLRIVIQDERLKKNYVLLSLDARKPEATPERLKAVRAGVVSPDTEQALRFIYTLLWDRTFPGDR
ncbi:ATPase [Paenibacillus thiaminolyticus]|uniref:ATPase n=1 Tax=Paenibacillus thiaminolyticus TaxID=49283 RepID=UPI001162C24F|nr:ATPase [Paenibacillus thiaminolyticus]NGP56937.1 ATPase [Paenibacillus thiaminolyticus]WCR27861.1 ATPase [Paenibacillus thiaminolyticus]